MGVNVDVSAINPSTTRLSVSRLPSCVAVFDCFLLLSFFEVAATFADLYPGANTTASLVYQTPHASNAPVSSLAQVQKPKTSLTSGSNVVTVDTGAQLVNLTSPQDHFQSLPSSVPHHSQPEPNLLQNLCLLPRALQPFRPFLLAMIQS